jgi:hypothetical protein
MPSAACSSLRRKNKDSKVQVDRDDGITNRSSCKEILALASSTYEYTMHVENAFRSQEIRDERREVGKERNQYRHPIECFLRFITKGNIFQVAVVELFSIEAFLLCNLTWL